MALSPGEAKKDLADEKKKHLSLVIHVNFM